MRPQWDGWIRFDSDCVVNGRPVKAGTSWGPFEKNRNPVKAIYVMHPRMLEECLRLAVEQDRALRPLHGVGTVHCDALEKDPLDSNDIRAWKRLARMLERALNAEREQRPPHPTTESDPCRVLCRECHAEGVCVKDNPHYGNRTGS